MRKTYQLRISDNWKPKIKTYAIILLGDNLLSTEEHKQENSGSRVVIPMDKGKLRILHSTGDECDIIHYKKLPEYLHKLEEEHWQVVLCLPEEVKDETEKN